MKATILRDGTLKVIPENEIEAWALQMWRERQEVLHIAYDEIEPPQGEEVGWWRTLKTAEARKLIGQEVRWRSIYSGCTRAGLVHEVRGKNIRVGADWQWLPDIQIEVPPAEPQGEEVG